MRRLFALTVLLSSLVNTRAAEVEFTLVRPQWRDAESFDRISEYLGGGENSGREIIRRTQADARAGYYFLVRVSQPTPLIDAKFVLNIIRPDSPEPKTFTFPAAAPASAAVFQLGLTGTDWPGEKKAHPVAWKLALLSADGRVLAEQKSFLWEKPNK